MADQQLGWREAIIEVLRSSTGAMHYADIAEEIAKRELRTSFGATPANTVNMYMSDSLKNDGENSPFDRTSRGYYRLREGSSANSVAQVADALTAINAEPSAQLAETQLDEAEEPAGLINALGMYWSRERVIWVGNPRLLGRQATSDESVDFSNQRGVYLLHDRNSVIYVGRAIDQGMGIRLRQHTVDRLNGRWDRFSWFGIYGVSQEGALEGDSKPFGATMLIATMEALLIESVEPSQNRRRGDDFRAVEFLQAIDPELERNMILQTMREFEKRLFTK